MDKDKDTGKKTHTWNVTLKNHRNSMIDYLREEAYIQIFPAWGRKGRCCHDATQYLSRQEFKRVLRNCGLSVDDDLLPCFL
jgi:hypothetical protein